MRKHLFTLFSVWILASLFNRLAAQDVPRWAEEWAARLDSFQARGQFKAVLAGADSLISRLPPAQNGLKSDLFSLKAKAFRRLGEHRQALEFHEKARRLRVAVYGKNSIQVARSLHNLGIARQNLGEKDHAADCWQQSLRLFENLRKAPAAELLAPMASLANAQFEAGRFAEAARLYEKMCVIQRDSVGENDLFARWTASLGNCQAGFGDFLAASRSFEKAHLIYLKTPDGPPVPRGQCLLNWGNNLLKMGDFEAAGRRLNEALPFFKNDSPGRADVLNSLGLLCRNRDFMPEATRFFVEAIDCFPENPVETDHRRTLAGFFRNLGTTYADRQDFENAAFYFEKSLEMWQNLPGYEPVEKSRGLVKLGIARRGQRDFAAAATNFRKALLELKNERRPEAFAPLFQLGELRLAENEPDAARLFFQKAAAAVQSVRQAEDLLFPLERVMVAEAISRAWRTRARHSNQPADWQKTLAEAQKGIVLFEKLKANLSSAQSQTEVQNLLFGVFNTAVEAAAALGQKEEAFRLASFYKNSFLKRLAERSGQRVAGGSPETVDLKAIRQRLTPSQTLLEFQWTDAAVFLFVVRRDTFLMEKLPVSAGLPDEISEFFRICSTNPESKNLSEPEQTSLLASLPKLGELLFRQLLAPVEKWLTADLVIVPDAWLCFLPFEALLKTAPVSGSPFGDWRFLVAEHSVRHLFSSGELLADFSKKGPRPGRSLLAVAPFFPEKTSAFKTLKFNREEAENIRDATGGEALLNDAARKNDFLAAFNQFEMLHFSTHGVLDDRFPANSFLAFAELPGDPENSRLRVDEISRFDFAASLVVLSACQTANGRFYHGEGLMSISQAFRRAGAGAVIASLWNVDDAQTPGFLANFYSFLQNGKSKSAALAEAKRRAAGRISGLKGHPFFWAGFVLHGDDEAVHFQKKNPWFWWGGGVAGLILLLVLGWRRLF